KAAAELEERGEAVTLRVASRSHTHFARAPPAVDSGAAKLAQRRLNQWYQFCPLRLAESPSWVCGLRLQQRVASLPDTARERVNLRPKTLPAFRKARPAALFLPPPARGASHAGAHKPRRLLLPPGQGGAPDLARRSTRRVGLQKGLDPAGCRRA